MIPQYLLLLALGGVDPVTLAYIVCQGCAAVRLMHLKHISYQGLPGSVLPVLAHQLPVARRAIVSQPVPVAVRGGADAAVCGLHGLVCVREAPCCRPCVR